MAVSVKSTRKAVEISWDALGGETEPDPPDGFPEHPIVLPPEVDNTLPGDQPRPDQGLPGDQPKPDQGLPGDQPKPDQGLPPVQGRPDQGLPGEQPGVEQPIFLPPYIDNSLPGAAREALKGFLVGNLPPATSPHGGKQIAVQVFAEGQEGDWSNTPVMPNDGLAVLTYPKDFTGESYIEVRSLDGAVIDSGTITVK
jgi:hypothetical protein